MAHPDSINTIHTFRKLRVAEDDYQHNSESIISENILLRNNTDAARHHETSPTFSPYLWPDGHPECRDGYR